MTLEEISWDAPSPRAVRAMACAELGMAQLLRPYLVEDGLRALRRWLRDASNVAALAGTGGAIPRAELLDDVCRALAGGRADSLAYFEHAGDLIGDVPPSPEGLPTP